MTLDLFSEPEPEKTGRAGKAGIGSHQRAYKGETDC